MTSRSPQRSPLAMTALLLLDETPMHAYGLRQRILEWGKDTVINVSQRNAIYQVVDHLERTGLIVVKETIREVNRPERIIYEPTEAGRAMARNWVLETLSTPTNDYPKFPAALAFLNSLTPKETRNALEKRAHELEQNIISMRADNKAALTDGVARLHLIENEYLLAVLQAELDWVHMLISDLAAKKITWRAPQRTAEK